MSDIVHQLVETIRESSANRTPLCLRGGGTKDFYGGPVRGETLGVAAHRGIVDYEPTELVVTARAGTPLAEVEAALRDKGQSLAFEPPHFGATATLGGAIAAGLSGPRRASAGAARDFVLGIRMLDGNGTELRFGGQVMKNVAGYDVSRVICGSMGTLGVILDVSLKVLPLPRTEITLHQQRSEAEAIRLMNQWAAQPLPLSGTAWRGGDLAIRLSGAESAVAAARTKIGGDEVDATKAAAFWQGLREQTDPYFGGDKPLWRLSVKSTTAPLALAGESLLEWNGALRWLRSTADAAGIRAAAAGAGGHATLFRGGDKSVGVFHPLSPVLARIHTRLKRTFDPACIFNPGRLYADW